MTAFLHRLGRFASAHPWRVIAVWLVIAAAIIGGGFGFGGKLADSFTIPGTESQAALDRLDAVFPQAAGGSARAIVVAPEGTRIDSAASKTVIADTITAIKKVSGVESVSSPFSEYSTSAVASDKRAAIIAVQFTKADDAVSTSTTDALTATGSVGEREGYRVSFSGQAFQKTSVGVSITEVFGVVFAGAVLFVTFGSLLAAGMPLITAIVGVVLSLAVIRIIALFTTVSTSAPTLALMLGLAVGIDYGLFIVSRHREQLAMGMAVAESIAAAVATAGTAVAFAGTTVIIALLGLLIVGIPFLSIMGVGAAFAVLVAVTGSLSLLPAVLALGGERFRPKPGSRTAKRAVAAHEGVAATMGARWVGLVAKAPIVPIIAVVAVLGVLAIPFASLQLSLPNNGSQPKGTSSRTAYDLTTKYFGEGHNGPLVLLFDVTQDNGFIDDLATIRTRLAALPDVAAVGKGTPNPSLDTAIMQVIPESGPASEKTIALVNRIRALEPTFTKDYDLPMSVTGNTAVQIDISNRLGNALLPFVLVVVGLSVVLLMAVFRSLVVPVKAAAGFLLSISASIGVTVAVFQWGWGAAALGVEAGPLLSFLPVLTIAILFGLSMDYEVFLVSGMREAWVHSGDARGSVRKGFIHGARVVTAAALIMIFVFASFIPEGSDVIKPIALSLAAGIVFDAFLVRMTLVPAVMMLVGRAGWYLPKWLDRLLPAVDIEGAGLIAQQADARWAEGERRWGLSSSGLRAAVDGAEALDLHAERGTTTVVLVAPPLRRATVATLTGHLAPADGRVQVDGRVAPSAAREVRAVAAPVIDDGAAWDATALDLVRERLHAAPRDHRSVSAGRWLAMLPDDIPLAEPVGRLRAEERLAVLAVAAVAGGASTVVVDAGDLGAEPEARLAALLDLVADGERTSVLVTSPPASASPALDPAARRKEISAR